MSTEMLDKESWERALGPTIRVVGYFAAIVLILFLGLYLLLLLLVRGFGFPEIVLQLFGTILPFAAVFFLVLSIFKVLDEELKFRK